MGKIDLYDHLKKENYNSDFEQWIKPFNDGSIFYQNWFHYIVLADSQLDKRNETDDCFQYTYYSNGEKILIHFNIGHIYSQCEKHPFLLLHKEKVVLNKFDTRQPCEYAYHSTINWKFPAHAISDFPVLCCYAPVQNINQMLVIDGNHRITIKKILHMKKVNVFEYQLNSALDFANDFEYVLFYFLLECNKPPKDRIIDPARIISFPWLHK